MSHAVEWSCRSCRSVLGHVRDGVLRPVVKIESVDARGVARLPCPDCGRVRAWVPSVGNELPVSSSMHENRSESRHVSANLPDT